MINLNITPGSSNAGEGIDVTSIVSQILESERAPERLLQTQQARITTESAALNSLSVSLHALQDKVNSLKDISGGLSGMLASSSQTNILTAAAQSSASAGSHVIVVNQLATTSSAYSDALASSSTTFATGNLQLQIGSNPAVNIVVDSRINTLDALATYINGQALGVTANIIQDANGSRLTLVSQTRGQPGDIMVVANSTGLNLTTIAGRNASLTIDGVPVSSPSNNVSGAVQGVTLNLASAAPGTQVQLEIAPDTTQAKEAIADFVSAYNTAISSINKQFAVDASTHTAGPLAANSSLRALQTSLLSDATYSITGNNGLISLASLGVDMNNDGTLTVNDAELSAVLSDQFVDVKNLFQSITSDGLARHFSSDLSSLMDSTQGVVALNLTQNASTLAMLTEQIDAFEDRMTLREQQLINEYSRIDVMLRQYPVLLSQITGQLDVLSQNS